MNDATQFFDSGGGGYQIERSLRFNPPDSAYLRRTPGVAGNRKTWTWAGWVKRAKLNPRQAVFSGHTGSGGNYNTIEFLGDQLSFFYGGTVSGPVTTAVFRDPSAWMHVCVALDTTQATASNRVKIYVNGVQQSIASGTYPTQNSDLQINAASLHDIGGNGGFDEFGGYLADIHFIDGQALTPSSFGYTDTNGVWQPIAYQGTYGTNGFHLPFSDNSTAAALGTDTSGNSNNWTVNNISVAAGAGNDSLVDTPTNYGDDTGAGGEVRGNYATLNPIDGAPGGLDNGNLDATYANAYPTIIPGSGQWYYEVDGTGYTWDGTKANWTLRSGVYNFGQRAWTSSAPSGYKALCTTNLPEPTIADGSTAMDVKLYTGNDSTQTISGLGFSPDFLWVKSRTTVSNHLLYDTVRGYTSSVNSNSTAVQNIGNGSTDLTGFTTDGFTLGGNVVGANGSSQNCVAWAWDAGSSTVTNNDGSITSQVRANPSAGFSITTFTTPTSGTFTVGHGLNVSPSLVICKARNQVNSWYVYHKAVGADKYLILESQSAYIPNSNIWQNTDPSSTLVYGGVSSWGTANYVMYSFAPVEGYSAFGSYTGNGSVDGPFVSCNFRPRWVLLKASSTTGNWFLLDTARLGYNQDNYALYPNLSASFSTTTIADILSNGFKLRQSDISVNGSAQTYIYAAFAENPFKTSRAR